MWYVFEGLGAFELLPWPGRQKETMRYREESAVESKMCRKILEEDELPWMRRRAGESFLRAVSLIERRPWGVDIVKEAMVARALEAYCGARCCCESSRTYDIKQVEA